MVIFSKLLSLQLLDDLKNHLEIFFKQSQIIKIVIRFFFFLSVCEEDELASATRRIS